MHYPVQTLRFSVSAALLLALCAGQAPAAHAQNVYIPTGTYTLDASNPVVGNGVRVIAGEDSSGRTSDPVTGQPYNATLNLVAGGSVVGGNVITLNSSVFNMSGGSVAVSNFWGGDVETDNNSVFNMSGGSVNYGVIAYDNSTVNISGGTCGVGWLGVYGISSFGNDTINFSGGTSDFIHDYSGAYGAADTINISGGTILEDVSAGGNTLTVTGGTIAQSLYADANINTISGGKVGKDYYGINYYDVAGESFTLIGHNLSATDLGAFFDPNQGPCERYVLSGTLLDGTNLNGDLLQVNDGFAPFTIQNVPEPGSVALLASLGLSGGVWLRRRRARA